MKKITLNNGYEMPSIGLGTWQAKDDDVKAAVEAALACGYRAIDTATIYQNEHAIGKALGAIGMERSEYCLTSKVWNDVSTAQGVKDAFAKSCEDMQTDYLDLYLIHWPGDADRNLRVYTALEDLYEQGKVKAIGVSNFLPHHLNELMADCSIVPMANQVETHIEVQNHRLKSYCDAHGIVMEAYAPMMSGKIQKLLDNEVMQQIARKHDHSVTQIALAWLVDRGIIALPKSTSATRIKANLDIFGIQLDAEDKEQIRGLNTGKKLFPDPDNVDFGFRD